MGGFDKILKMVKKTVVALLACCLVLISVVSAFPPPDAQTAEAHSPTLSSAFLQVSAKPTKPAKPFFDPFFLGMMGMMGVSPYLGMMGNVNPQGMAWGMLGAMPWWWA